jgi:hypothetical protein
MTRILYPEISYPIGLWHSLHGSSIAQEAFLHLHHILSHTQTYMLGNEDPA